jgi:ATP-dependent Clp protease ATP-binding subunit ClpA
MFTAIKHKVRDVATVARLSEEAEQFARGHGTNAPGSEHYVLAALVLPDKTALRAFEHLGLTSEAFATSIHAQYMTSLERLGLKTGSTESTPQELAHSTSPGPRLFTAAASGQALMQRIAASASERRSRPLLGADVLLATTGEQHSVAARAFRHLGIDPRALEVAAHQAIQHWAHAPGEA